MPELQRLDLLTCFREAPAPLDFVLPGMVAGTVGLIVGMGSAGKSMLASPPTTLRSASAGRC